MSLKLISTKKTNARKVTTYTGEYSDFIKMAEKHGLGLESPLKSGTIYAVSDSCDLAFRPQKGNIIKFTEWFDC